MAVLFLSSVVWATDVDQNWHQWRGPHADGFAPKGNPPVKWDENTNIKWKVEIPGEGHATPIVWDNQVFVVSAVKTDRVKEGAEAPKEQTQEQRERPPRPEGGFRERGEGGRQRPEGGFRERGEGRGQRGEGQRGEGRRGGRGRGGFRGFGGGPAPTNYYEFNVMSLDRNTGKVLWQKTVVEEVPHENHHQTGTFASGSPTTDGKNLYVTFGSRGIYSYDLKGNLNWKKDLGDMKTKFSFGEGCSIVVHGDSLIVNWDHEGQSFIANLDTETGDVKWKVDRDENTSWSTPLIVEHKGKTQVITNASNKTRSYDLSTGELIWECGGQTANAIPSSVTKDGLVYCISGFRGFALYAIPLDSKGDITGTEKIAWKLLKDTPYVPSPLLYDDQLYFLKGNNAILSSVSAKDGSVKIEAARLDIKGGVYASPVGAAGKVYISTREGETLVIKHGDTLEVLATNKLDEGINASPAVAGNQLFIRGKNHLYCIQES